MEDIHIIIPYYNGKKFILETLNSIFEQTYTNFILTIIDDKSTDDTIPTLKDIKDSRLNIIQNKKKSSITNNFNNCVKYAKTELFCIMHQDDIYEPNYLEEMLKGMSIYKDAVIAHCDFFTIDETNSKILDMKYELKRKLFSNQEEYTFKDYLDEFELLMMGDYIICPSVMYRRSIFEEIGYFDERYSQVEDWDFYLKVLLNQNRILRVNKQLFNYRIHKKTKSNELVKNLVKYKEEIFMLNAHYQTAKNKNFSLGFTERKLYNNVFKILLWDIKNDLLQNQIFLAMKKLNFALTDFPYIEFKIIALFLFPVVILGKSSGKILDFFALKILDKKSHF